MVAIKQEPTRKRAARVGKPDGIIYDAGKHVEIITILRADGLSEEAVAERIGITRQTLIQWKKKYPEVAEAIGETLPPGVDVKYEPLYHPKVVEYMRKVGKTIEQICFDLGRMSKSTYYEWVKKYPAFAAAASFDKSPVDNEMYDNLRKVAGGYKVTKSKKIYEFSALREKDKDGNYQYDKRLVREEVIEEDVPPNINAIKAYLINRDPGNWTESGRELTLKIKTDNKELTPDEQKMATVIKAIPVNDSIKMAKIMAKMPPEITVKWIELGNINILGEYIVEHPELLEILNENNGEANAK